MGEAVYDKIGREIIRGDLVKVYHFTDSRRRRHYMYKQCLGVGTYPGGQQKYVFFSHLNFRDGLGERDGPYHEHIGSRLKHYEIVQSIDGRWDERPLNQAPSP